MADADLRPMTLGEVLDRTFKIYRNHFWLFAAITALPSGVLLLFRVANSAWTVARVGHVSAGQLPNFDPFNALTTGIIMIVSILAALVFTGYAHAATIFAVSDIYLGGTPGLRRSYKRVGTKAFRVLGIFLLLSLAIGVAFLFLIIPGIWVACRVAVSVPAGMLENASTFRSVDRSMQLTKGHAGQIFVIYLLLLMLFYVVALLFQTPILFLLAAGMKSQQGISFFVLLASNFASFISEVLVWPVATIALTLMYYNLRVRKEAFDLQHQIATLGPNPTLGTPSAV